MTNEPQPKNPGKPSDLVRKMLEAAFKAIRAKPERLSINVLLKEGDELKGIYVIPGRQNPYIREEEARAEIRDGETLYRLDVYRVI